MKSTLLKAIKTVALSLVLALGASSLVFANGAGNGAGTPTATKVALNGGGNGAGGTKSRKHRRVARRHGKAKSKTA
jgi:hypothetical protein